MGVPRFFRWLAEKMPLIIQPYDYRTFCHCDNLFLDMNGILHNCTHGNEKITVMDPVNGEENFIGKVFSYVEKIFEMVNPTKNFFLGIDGVAPRAKMNQQRIRRFASAKEKEIIYKQGYYEDDEGNYFKPPPRDKMFDSNSITPGTKFMDKIDIKLREFIKIKIQNDVKWRECKRIIYSSHLVPGEGEHKILNFIRCRKNNSLFKEYLKNSSSEEKNLFVMGDSNRAFSHKDYDYEDYLPNEVNCIHGLDADLIMLALSVHEPNFFVLREDVFERYKDKPSFFNKSKKKKNDESEKKKEREIMEKILNDKENRNPDKIDILSSKLNEVMVSKPLDNDFEVLCISVMRDYLRKEILDDSDLMDDTEALERVIDDFIFITFFCGNDFLPHTHFLDIKYGAMQEIISAYKKVLFSSKMNSRNDLNFLTNTKKIPNYVNFKDFSKLREKSFDDETFFGFIDLDNVELLLAEFEQIEKNVISQLAEDLTKRKRGKKRQFIFDGFFDNEENDDEMDNTNEDRILKFITSEDDSAFPKIDFNSYRMDYYNSKLEIDISSFEPEALILNETNEKRIGKEEKDEEEFTKLLEENLTGIYWTFLYYYSECVSWSWYFPFHYSPFSSDLQFFLKSKVLKKKLREKMFSFLKDRRSNIDKPFSPFEQLISVLPPFSLNLLPEGYSKMIESPKLKNFFPKYDSFVVDMEGCKFEWEATLLIPFIDQKVLLEVENDLIKSKIIVFDSVETKLNSLEENTQYSVIKMENDNIQNFEKKSEKKEIINFVNKKKIFLKIESLNIEMKYTNMKNVNFCTEITRGTFFPGKKYCVRTIPSLFFNSSFNLSVERKRLRVFSFPSRNPNSILTEMSTFKNNTIDIEKNNQIFKERIGKRVFVRWPFPLEGVLCGFATNYSIFRIKENMEVLNESYRSDADVSSFSNICKMHVNALKIRFGLEFDVHVLFLVKIFQEKQISNYWEVNSKFQSNSVVLSSFSIFSENVFIFPSNLCMFVDEDSSFLADRRFINVNFTYLKLPNLGDEVVFISKDKVDQSNYDYFGSCGRVISKEYRKEKKIVESVCLEFEKRNENLHKKIQGLFCSDKEFFYSVDELLGHLKITKSTLMLLLSSFHIRGGDSNLVFNLGVNFIDFNKKTLKGSFVRVINYAKNSKPFYYYMNFGSKLKNKEEEDSGRKGYRNKFENKEKSKIFDEYKHELDERKIEFEISQKGCILLMEYNDRFPEVFRMVNLFYEDLKSEIARKAEDWKSNKQLDIEAREHFMTYDFIYPTSPSKGIDEFRKITEFLASQEHAFEPQTSFNYFSLESSKIKQIEECILENDILEKQKKKEKILLEVNDLRKIYIPPNSLCIGSVLNGGIRLGSIVSFIKNYGIVPFGASGVVIAMESDFCRVMFFSPFLCGSNMNGILKSFRSQVVKKGDLVKLND